MNYKNIQTLVLRILFVSILFVFNGCVTKNEPLQTVSSVDLKKYVGKWFEISSFPQRFQKGCNCTTADYEITDKDYVKVTNSCRLDSVNGKLKIADGKAFVVENSNNSKLKVQFFWPFKGDYWIIDLGENYEYAVIGNEGREYLWILSRNASMETSMYDSILSRAKAKGFDINKLVITNQECNKNLGKK